MTPWQVERILSAVRHGLRQIQHEPPGFWLEIEVCEDGRVSVWRRPYGRRQIAHLKPLDNRAESGSTIA